MCAWVSIFRSRAQSTNLNLTWYLTAGRTLEGDGKNVWHSSWARMTPWTLVCCSMYEQKCVRLYLFCPRHQWLTLDRPVQWLMNKTNLWSASDIMFFWLFYASRCLLSSSSTVSFSVCLLCSQTQPAYWSSRPPTPHGASMAPSMFLLSHRI